MQSFSEDSRAAIAGVCGRDKSDQKIRVWVEDTGVLSGVAVVVVVVVVVVVLLLSFYTVSFSVQASATDETSGGPANG